MFIDLDRRSIVDTFKAALPNMHLIPASDYDEIETRLYKLINIKHGTNTPKKYGRFAKTHAAEWLWRYLLIVSLKDITANMRGYNNLLDYYKQYVHYENVLFSLFEDHRDHVIHSIWVMLIGFYLMKKCRPLVLISYDDVLDTISEDDTLPTNMLETERIIKKHELALWFLIALTHDLGYPIQKTIAANRAMSNMISNFGFLSQTEFSYNFTIVHRTAIDELLNTISTRLVWLNNGSYRLGYDSGWRLDYAKSFERMDHGIMSAYLIQKYLDHICESMNVPQGITEFTFSDVETAAVQAIIVTWFSSISSHTNENAYWPTVDNMATLLFLSDELDEFSRYSHQRNSDQWMNVECNTRFKCTKKSIEFMYIFQKRIDFDVVSFFKRKIEKIMNRFELSKDAINKLSIACIDCREAYRRKRHPDKYYYERRYSSDSLGFIKKSYGKTTKDVLGFLKGRVEL
jgi:hypothetical protein